MGVCVLLGSKSDLEKAQKAFDVFREFGVKFDVHIASAHRTPDRVKEIVDNSKHDVFLVFADGSNAKGCTCGCGGC